MIQGKQNYIFKNICRNLNVFALLSTITIDPNLTFASFRKISLLYISFRIKAASCFMKKKKREKKSWDSLRKKHNVWWTVWYTNERWGCWKKDTIDHSETIALETLVTRNALTRCKWDIAANGQYFSLSLSLSLSFSFFLSFYSFPFFCILTDVFHLSITDRVCPSCQPTCTEVQNPAFPVWQWRSVANSVVWH